MAQVALSGIAGASSTAAAVAFGGISRTYGQGNYGDGNYGLEAVGRQLPLAGASDGLSTASGVLSITLGPPPPSPPYIRASTMRPSVHTAGVRFHQQRRRVA